MSAFLEVMSTYKKSFAAILMIVVMLSANMAQALTVEKVRFGKHPDKIRMVLELSERADYKAYVLSSPYRVVIDTPRANLNIGDVSSGQVPEISDIRHGHPVSGLSRIVIDSKKPLIISNSFHIVADGKNAHRLVIDLKPVGVSVFEQARGKTFGTLDTNAATQTAASVKAAPAKGINTAPLSAAPPKISSPATPQPDRAAQMLAGVPIPLRKPVRAASATPKVGTVTKKPLIIIDPGHGGVDPGAIGANGVFEKHIALAAAKELKRQLLATGRYRVMMTRENDVYLRLYQRVNFARKNEGDLFISLHADSIRKSGVRGASVYTLSEKASDSQTAALAARENRSDLIAGVDLTHEDKDVANILLDLTMRDTMNQSTFFANVLVDTMALENIRTLDNPHRYAGFAVLKAPDIPSVLVEMGFLSNRTEAEMLSKDDYRRKIMKSLVRGIEIYFDRAMKNQRI